MKRKRRVSKLTHPENNMRIFLIRLNGEKENQSDDFHDYEEEQNKEEWERAFGDQDSDSSFVMPGDDTSVDLGLQIVLLESALLRSSSTPTNQDSSQKIPRDGKLKGICTDSLNPLWTFGSWEFSVREGGEPSCGYCVICNDAKPIRSIIQRECGHHFCEDCFRIYLGQKIQENILTVMCPEKDCKRSIEARFWRRYVPEEVFGRREMACHEGRILLSPEMILCPHCLRLFIDDRRRFLIRACTKCWKIFCMNCRVRWHMGMSCEKFQLWERISFWSVGW